MPPHKRSHFVAECTGRPGMMVLASCTINLGTWQVDLDESVPITRTLDSSSEFLGRINQHSSYVNECPQTFSEKVDFYKTGLITPNLPTSLLYNPQAISTSTLLEEVVVVGENLGPAEGESTEIYTGEGQLTVGSISPVDQDAMSSYSPHRLTRVELDWALRLDREDAGSNDEQDGINREALSTMLADRLEQWLAGE
ncbi:hypothetical protein B0H13DRAFT_1851353 [Mycena leptocephala]|nr:hypothetical protein B0H13DRAFT_1851353 [Mycena leptocephala]